ncbi:helix-turn-helix transcriptional regulator [Sphingobium aromaticivastans]|uniref:helix-turn-helix domain-containing protein n=1 Tax=Sphingobium aromaticivastans TaxID=1778665 RepID=UPI00301A68D9
MADPQHLALLQTLKGLLRQREVKQSDIASRFGASAASVKRWLAGRGLTLDRLEQLCAMAGVTLADLVELSQDHLEERILQLTLAQERALAADGALTFLFFALLNGWPPADFARDFDVPDAMMTGYFERLSRLGLVRVLPGGRVKPLAARRVRWRRGGPLARHFEARVKRIFFDVDFGSPETHYLSDIAKLSDRGVQRIDELTEAYRRDFQAIAEEDRRLGSGLRRWLGMMVVTRALDLSDLAFDPPARRSLKAKGSSGSA